ncbi:MAG TPA: AAA family ATPase, partial [Acidimicrobiales bacterium]|nr:AAA family ATPase [Acidimicrobiales bacterium]
MGLETDRRRGSVGVALSTALAAATEGSGGLALLLGEAGIGKTTTARDLAAEARRGGVTVRWSACWSGGGTVAHAPWLTLLSGLGPPGRRAMEVLLGTEPGTPGEAGAARASAYAAVVAALDEATADRPALLVVDDLHWADEGTLQLLDVVAAHVPGLRALVIGTYRDTDVPAGSPLTRIGGSAERFTLGGLDRAGIAGVLRDHVGAGRGAELARPVEDLTGGNPFLVGQLGRLLATDPSGLARGALPAGARDLLQQRLGALRAGDRAVLAAAAVLGSPFRTVDVEHVVAGSTDEAAPALDRAAALRIVERAPGTGAWAFVHDLFRQATLDGTTPAERVELHRTAAVVMQQADAEPAIVARHLLAAGDGAAAAAWSVRAGDRALAAMAWEEAAAHHERALAALPPGSPGSPDDDPVRPDALAGLGRA